MPVLDPGPDPDRIVLGKGIAEHHHIGIVLVFAGEGDVRRQFLLAAAETIETGQNAVALRIENRKKTNRMKRIVNDHSVEKDLVLDGRSSPDIKLPPLVSGKNDSRKYLQILGKISLPAY